MNNYQRESRGASGGIGISTVLLIVFIVLKLTKVISWSWWWVLAPLWIPLALAGILIALGMIFGGGR